METATYDKTRVYTADHIYRKDLLQISVCLRLADVTKSLFTCEDTPTSYDMFLTERRQDRTRFRSTNNS
jgi:hypothetical protein